MKLLNGRDLAEFIKVRQAGQVRALRQAHGISPKLSIVLTIDHPAIELYVRMKKKYGADILIDVEIHKVKQTEVPTLLDQLNNDDAVHGIIIQLPLEKPDQTDELVNLVSPQKDVDALGSKAMFQPATPMAILWLLSGYNIELKGQKVLLVGRGKLVGAPLERILKNSEIDVTVAQRGTTNLAELTQQADIIITATGTPNLLTTDMIKPGTVVVDAGVAGEEGKTVGDLAPEIYLRDDLTVTPTKGGVGPLTVSALFENVIRAAQVRSESAD